MTTRSVVIATCNRAEDLRETLHSLASTSTNSDWEVIVVDNNSTDDTRRVVDESARHFPTRLTYLFEAERGRSAALNAGFRASHGDIVLTTDDDVRVPREWLDTAAAALVRLDCAFVGGRVLPIWGGNRPAWLPEKSGRHWGPLALFDIGPTPVEFATRAPLGVNMAVRREALARVGDFDNTLGRKLGTLLGQEVREWCLRARAAGLRGFYIPEMVIYHKVPAARLTKNYFRRSFYWRGVSRAILYQKTRVDMDWPETTALDFTRVPHVAGVPRYMYRSFLTASVDYLRARARRNAHALLESEMQLAFYAGVFVQTWKMPKHAQVTAAGTRDNASQ